MLACGEKHEHCTADRTQGYTTRFTEASARGSREIFVDSRTEQLTCWAGYLDDGQNASVLCSLGSSQSN